MKAEDKFRLYKPKKFLGQNFLVDDNISRKIVSALDIGTGDEVLEIGPGRGALTKHLANATKHLTAVEFDKAVFRDLESAYMGKANIVHADILDYDFAAHAVGCGRKLRVIGNIPYNITSKILFKLFDAYSHLDVAVLMVQKEVALRLTAVPSTKDYGILSVQTQVYCNPEIIFHVPPGAFFPRPSVRSSIIRLNFGESSEIRNVLNADLFKDLVRGSFGQRRKVMSNSLGRFFEFYRISPADLNFDFSRRPETLTPEEFVKLSNEIFLHTRNAKL